MRGAGRVFLLTALACAITAGVVAADEQWITVGPQGPAGIVAKSGGPPSLAVTRSELEGFRTRVDTTGFGVRIRTTKAGEFVELLWPDASISGEVGKPALPVVRRLFVTSPKTRVSLQVHMGEARRVSLSELGLPWRVMPVQPPIEKLPGARERAVLHFDESAYSGCSHLKDERVTIERLGIARGLQLYLLEIRPLAYHPDQQSLTVWPKLQARVTLHGGKALNQGLDPLPGLRNIVLNPEVIPVPVKATGNYLIIVDNDYESAIASFASAKSAQGFSVTTHTVNGDSNSAIKSYIESLWGGANSPDFVLLVGDTNTIPHWTGGGEGSPATDLPYSCMDGSSDWYPDIALGRFPVRSTTDVQAIVDKTLYYENGPLADPDYKMRAVFMAGEDNYSITEGTHNWVISNYMSPNGYSYDRLYMVTYGAGTADVRNAFNAGRFFGIYSGHGAESYWADGPPFYQSDVNGLTNTNMYPAVWSFACVTGTYTNTECFTETWILAPDKGAVTIYGSSVNSYWTEDDVLEKRLFDSIFDDGDSVPDRIGAIWNDARMRYLSEMGSGSTTRRYFEMYNLMGDPSLMLLGSESPPSGLQVTPGTGLVSEGPSGGPFTPDSIVYTLENLGDSGINYTVSNNESWVSLSNTSGYLSASSSTDVTVSINASAGSLANGEHSDTVSFTNTTDHVGDTTRDVSLTVGVETPQYSWSMDSDPGWTTQGLWAWGQPSGGGGQYGGPDPTSGYTGSNVYGYNLSGDYENNLSETHLTSTAIDCTGLTNVTLKLWRWLGVEQPSYDHAYVRVSNNGSSWTTIWENSAVVEDSAWSQQEYDISSVADNQATVYLRWTIGTTDGSWQYCGWNIDDVEIWGLGGAETCSDGILNQGEDLIDCGGPCPACSCLVDNDCSDGLFCTGSESCDGYGECQAGSDPCPTSLCDDDLDQCVDCLDNDDCDDGLFCNGAETCSSGSCLAGSDPCPGQSCDEVNDICEPLPSGLEVTPGTGLVSEGPAGGPFTPNSVVYTLENVGDTGFNYTVSNSESWVSLSNTSGYLAAYASTDVTVSINANADSLASGGYSDTVTFTNTTDHVGDTTRNVNLTVSGEGPYYSWSMDTDPGWTTQGQWAWGQPTGGGGQYGGPDPTSGYTGSNVYGYNLSGDYENNLSETHLTSTAIDCTGLTNVTLKFWRWLGVEQPSYDHAYVRVSNDGSTWTTIWENSAVVEDSAWSQHELDISSVADNQATVYLRWTMGTTDGSWQYCGWNIDDVEIWQEAPPACDVDEGFESGAGGWTNSASSTCTTGDFVAATPTEVVNTVVTQPDGAHAGSNAWFTATNSAAGTDDVDGGVCITESPVYNVTADSDVSAYYFHGQRDAGDDSSGDYFYLEVSINGGAWTSLAAYGDVQNVAAWTQVSTTASAGDTVQLRIRVSDGPSAGDLVEGGIDSVKICEQ
jgi:hypothetical protein